MFQTLSDRERIAVQHYDETVRQGDLTDTAVWVDDFTGRVYLDLSPEDEVVDIGCRLGRFVPLLPQLGISRYLGIDPSVESIEYCKRTYAEVDYCQVQFETGEARLLGNQYPERFAGFMLAAVLMHIPREGLRDVLISIRGCLKYGAQGFFSTPLGEEGRDLEVINRQGLELSLYTEEELVEGFTQAGFTFVRTIYPSNMILGHVVAT